MDGGTPKHVVGIEDDPKKIHKRDQFFQDLQYRSYDTVEARLSTSCTD